jgi:hypothetical protein
MILEEDLLLECLLALEFLSPGLRVLRKVLQSADLHAGAAAAEELCGECDAMISKLKGRRDVA